MNVVQTVINNKIIDFNEIKQASVQSYAVYLRLPRLGGISDRFAKQILQTVQRCYFSANCPVVSPRVRRNKITTNSSVFELTVASRQKNDR